MAMRRKTWVWAPRKQPKSTVPAHLKESVRSKGDELVQKHLKPAYIKPPPTNPEMNYIIDIWTRWYQSYFYFCATYASPSPHALSPTFELRFARMGYIGNERFNLAYMRHTGNWNEIYFDLSVDECMTAIRDEPYFLR